MRLAGSTFAGILFCLASGLASAGGVDWVVKGTEAALIPAGRDAAGAMLHLCRAPTMLLGKFWTSGAGAGQCHVGTPAGEQVYEEFDMLVEASKPDVAYKWVPGHATSYPQHSVVAGLLDASGGRSLVCAALNAADNSVHPGYISDENCVYALNGRQVVAENYLVLASNDPEEATTQEAQPALEGFDPRAILGAAAITAFCGTREGLCAPALPALQAAN